MVRQNTFENNEQVTSEMSVYLGIYTAHSVNIAPLCVYIHVIAVAFTFCEKDPVSSRISDSPDNAITNETCHQTHFKRQFTALHCYKRLMYGGAGRATMVDLQICAAAFRTTPMMV